MVSVTWTGARMLALVVASVVALTTMPACSADTHSGTAAAPSVTSSAPATAPTSNATGPQSFDTVAAFKDAVVAAGFDCEPWEPSDEQEKGTCNDTQDLLAVLDDEAALRDWVANYKADKDSTYPVIYGGNWLMVVDSTAELGSMTAKMYGTAYTPPPPPEPIVSIDCDGKTYEIFDLSNSYPVFRKAWAGKHEECDGSRRDVALTNIEKKALKASKYDGDDNGMADLYAMCAENEKDDYFSDKGNSPSGEQAAELKGWLALCPRHPKAKIWKAAIKRGQEEAKLVKSGRSFYAGTYRVGKEVSPGTYAIKGDIENCYWERQDRNGNIIDNNFVRSAKRVQVTIRSSDYSFSSDGCGNWRPAS